MIPLCRAARASRGFSTNPNNTPVGNIVKNSVKNFLHGSGELKKQLETTHSALIERGKYVHKMQTHNVKPEAFDDYAGLVKEQYTRLANDPNFKMKLFGSWEVEIGNLDQAIHIWEFNNYPGYTEAWNMLRRDEEYQKFQTKLRPMLNSRKNQILLEFAFWNNSAPANHGGIYELRSYTIRPGSLLEWEQEWKRGLEARRKYAQPIGAFFSQIGDLNMVHHMWTYPDLQARKKSRESAWKIDGWAETVVNTVKLVKKMNVQILRPFDWSPLK